MADSSQMIVQMANYSKLCFPVVVKLEFSIGYYINVTTKYVPQNRCWLQYQSQGNRVLHGGFSKVFHSWIADAVEGKRVASQIKKNPYLFISYVILMRKIFWNAVLSFFMVDIKLNLLILN